jgi:SRSO17 transposase
MLSVADPIVAQVLPTVVEARLRSYLEEIGGLLRNKKRREAFALYACGLYGDGDRKSVEPIAARACGRPEATEAMHAKLLYFLGRSSWEDTPIRRFAAEYAISEMVGNDPIRSWIVDDTGFLKQGTESPGVQRQYTGSAGKTANCQIGVSLVVANDQVELPVDFRLYLPESWTDDRARCEKAHIPADVGYAPKWQLALDMIEAAKAAQMPTGVVLADSGFGHAGPFRDRLTELKLTYAVEVKSNTVVRRILSGGTLGVKQSVKKLGRRFKSKFRRVTWREGTRRPLHSRFARVRVVDSRENSPPQWLLIEWPEGEAEPTKFVLCTMPKGTSLKQMVRTFKSRWRIERSYEDLKGELGLDHYEGRSFIGWHHHVTVVLVCYAFLVAERSRSFFPSTARTDHPSAFANAA